jgi:hypothetical protein
MKSSAKSGQSQLLIPLLMIITSAIVFATNVTLNMTNQTPMTGAMIGIPTNSQEFSFPIEIWANTSINLNIENNLVKAALILDNSSAVSNQLLNFYLNDTLLFSDKTDDEGMIVFPIPFPGIIKAVFSGSDYLNPSENQIGNGFTENEMNTTDFSAEDFALDTNKTEILGNLTITVFNFSEDSYKTFDLDENYERIEQKYYKVYIKVFNNFSKIPGIYTLEDNEIINISLEDKLGNSYGQNDENMFLDLNLFGNSMEISPSTGREGYLIFLETKGIPEKLVFRTKSGAKAEFGLR